MNSGRFRFLGLLVVAGCASSGAASNARVRPALTGAAHCAEVRERAEADPALEVEKLPTPVKRPSRLLAGPFPPGVIRNGYADVHTTVVVDTLGRPVMKTFRVRKASHPWLGQDVKKTLSRWTFSPAELEGCKVARVYKVDATTGVR
ncbi:MAG TPA: hypothetical protein VG432_01825 [Gemmatimonadaceae bacterium]|nr:hypothetical protein [Gemmatimonadaceae bacterium]